jgi:hypothetical protein
MRTLHPLAVAAALGAAAAMPAQAADPFDACAVFTQDDAAKALGTTASGEPANPKARRARNVMACTYQGVKGDKPVAASAQFRFARTEAEAQRAFDDARLKFQTKPMLLSGAEAFWSGKTGQMNLRKGRTWVTLSVGPEKLAEREFEEARRLAEILAKKL